MTLDREFRKASSFSVGSGITASYSCSVRSVVGQSRVDKVRPGQPPEGLGSYRGKEWNRRGGCGLWS